MTEDPPPPPLHARVHYTELMVRGAVRCFVRRSLLRRAWVWLGAVALLAAGLGLDLRLGSSFGAGFAAASMTMIAAFWAAVWIAHFRATVGRFRRLDPPEAAITADAEGLTFASSLGRSILPWQGFVQVWALPDCWMLFTAPNQFLTLPTRDLTPAMLAMLRSRLPPPS